MPLGAVRNTLDGFIGGCAARGLPVRIDQHRPVRLAQDLGQRLFDTGEGNSFGNAVEIVVQALGFPRAEVTAPFLLFDAGLRITTMRSVVVWYRVGVGDIGPPGNVRRWVQSSSGQKATMLRNCSA